MESEELESEEWKVKNGKWRTGKWRIENGELKMENWKWRIENGELKMEMEMESGTNTPQTLSRGDVSCRRFIGSIYRYYTI